VSSAPAPSTPVVGLGVSHLETLQRLVIQSLFVIALIAAWFVIVEIGIVSPLLLPSPVAVFDEIRALVSLATFWTDVTVTILSIVAAYSLAIVSGLVVGVVVGQNRFAYDVFSPIFSGLFAIPLIILYPLALYVAGIGPASKIIFAATYGFFPIVLAAMSGFANIPPRYIRYVNTLGANSWLVTRKLLIPAALPEMLNGLRVSFVVTFASVIAGEMIAAFYGVGRSISYNAEILEPARMFALIFFVVLFAAAVNMATSRLKTGAPAW
jgi:ABC-type nitrate/sulfonate/bicarbonate transport system permease component